MLTLKLDLLQTLSLAAVVYFIGISLRQRIGWLERLNIPAAVIGGCSSEPGEKSDIGIFSTLSTKRKPGGMNSPKGTRWRLRKEAGASPDMRTTLLKYVKAEPRNSRKKPFGPLTHSRYAPPSNSLIGHACEIRSPTATAKAPSSPVSK